MESTYQRRLLLGAKTHRIDSKAPFIYLEGAFFWRSDFWRLKWISVFSGRMRAESGGNSSDFPLGDLNG